MLKDPELRFYLDNYDEMVGMVDRWMGLVETPPANYQNAYDALKNYYEAFLIYSNLVVNPEGDIETFLDDLSGAKANFSACHGQMESYY